MIEAVGDTLEPHRLCNYLYELATRYHRFFERCPVLRADDDATRDSRLALCALVARTLERARDAGYRGRRTDVSGAEQAAAPARSAAG